ncbi:DUF885 domain-containing protein [Streptomyces sp. NBC_01565]|uniref:DUF885 domain-containing protein n=1 Tax=unclassified Streptomyces TaxID=2593676 RepID=UPI00224D6B30|nr:DUF885 domain-containing protein [Streptomyces sp. NBC_01565]MCX4539495.1 DUF885 domain-containing protein [Streptomyces sp. NBC_01565]
MPTHPRELPRRISDDHVDALVALDPIAGTYLGTSAGAGGLPDYSPDGARARADLARATLARLTAAETALGGRGGATLADVERRCARLLRERLEAELAQYEAGEHLRAVDNLSSPLHQVRKVFGLMPSRTPGDWEDIARRLRAVPGCLSGYRASLAEGVRRGLPAAPRQVRTNVAQLREWLGPSEDGGFTALAAGAPPDLAAEVATAARAATGAFAELREWFERDYGKRVDGTPDAVGRERYARLARYHTGADLDLDEAYDYGWAEFHRLLPEMRAEAARILPGGRDPWETLAWLDGHGRSIEGVEETRIWLQTLMDEARDALDGRHFDIATPVRSVESRVAPPGGAAAPYYTQPSLDFSRPGRTWLPTLGRTRFPTHHLVSTWYHEGLPGHHLQLGHWTFVAADLSRYQTKVAKVSATTEGWALYAERLMDELGFLTDPQHRLGHLDAQMMRAVRVVIDIGMHLRLRIPAHAPFHPGEMWTPSLAREFLGRYSGHPAAYLDSEVIRYLGLPGQAITYKLGERAWLQGRDDARAARGSRFDLKRWHMAALSLGSLGLSDLREELGSL